MSRAGKAKVFSPSINAATGDEAARPLVLCANGLTVDFRQAVAMAQKVELSVTTLNGSTEPIDVYFFAGQHEAGTDTMTPGGTATFVLPEGTTSLVLVPRDVSVRQTGLQIGAITLTADTHAQQPAGGEELTPMTNARIAQLTADPSWNQPLPEAPHPQIGLRQWQTFLGRNQIYTYDHKRPGSKGGNYLVSLSPTEANQYRRVTANGNPDGFFQVGGLYYIGDNWSLVQFPRTHYSVVGQDILLAPGAPATLVVSFGSGGTMVFRQTASGSTFESVKPITTMKVSMTPIKVDAQPAGSEGVRDDDRKDHPWELPVVSSRATFQVLMKIVNDSPVGGTARVDVHGGPTGTLADPLDSTWYVPIGGYQSKLLLVNVTAEGDPSASVGRPTASFFATMSDNSQTSAVVTTQKSRSMDPPRVSNGDGTFSSGKPPSYSTEELGRIARIARKNQAAYEQRVAHGTTRAYDDNIDYYRATEIALSNYNSAREAEGMTIVENADELQDTPADIVFDAAGVELLRQVADAQDGTFDELVHSIESALRGEFFVYDDGVKTVRLPVHLASHDFAHSSIEADDVFIGFERKPDQSVAVTLVAAATNYPANTPRAAIIGIYSSFIISRPEYVEAVRNGLADDFFNTLNTPADSLTFGAQLQRAFQKFVEKVEVDQTGGPDLSVSGDPIERAILGQIASHPPVNGAWRWDIGSGQHRDTATNHAFHAVDLNLGGGNDDRRQPIKAVADGTVIVNQFDSYGNSTLVIKHELDADGDGIKETVWHSKILHHQKVGYTTGDPLPELAINAPVRAGDTLAEVSNISNIAGMTAHLHFEVLDEWMQSIDIRKLLTDAHGMNLQSVTATDGGIDRNLNTPNDGETLAVKWNEGVNAWTNLAKGLIYDRLAQQSGVSDAAWTAWHDDPGQRARVFWIHQLPDSRIVDGWLKGDYSQKWNSHTRQWEVL